MLVLETKSLTNVRKGVGRGEDERDGDPFNDQMAQIVSRYSQARIFE